MILIEYITFPVAGLLLYEISKVFPEWCWGDDGNLIYGLMPDDHSGSYLMTIVESHWW